MGKIVNAAKSRTTQNVAAASAPSIVFAQALVDRLEHLIPQFPWENSDLDATNVTTAFLAMLLATISSRILAFVRSPEKRANTYQR